MDSRFDGMVDCVMPNSEANFSKVDPTKLDFSKPDFGLEGFGTLVNQAIILNFSKKII